MSSHITELQNKLKNINGGERLPVLLKLAKSFLHIQPEKTVKYGDEAAALAREIKDFSQEAEALRNSGNGNFLSGNLTSSIKNYSQSLKIEYTLNNKSGISKCYNNMAVVYSQMGDDHRALNNYLKALSLFEEMDNHAGIAASTGNIGIIYKNFGDFERALEYYKKSLKIAEKDNNAYGIAAGFNNIGEVYSNKEDYDQAIKYFKKSLLKASEIQNQEIQVLANHNLGVNYFLKDEFAISLDYLLESFRMCDESKLEDTKVNVLINIGKVYTKLGTEENAKKYLDMAAELIQTVESAEARINLSHSYYELNQSVGNFQEALTHYIEYSKLKEKIYSQKTKKKIEELNARHVLADKEKEMEVYRRSILDLKKLNDTKDKFFSIIAHDLRNPIHSLLGVISYLSENFNEMTKEELKELSGDLKDSCAMLYDLIANLLEWSQLQMGGLHPVPEKFDLMELIQFTCKLLREMALGKKIDLKCEIDTPIFVFADKNMISSVLRSIIVNSIKFSKNNGSISITAEPNDTMVALEISDAGIGISDELQQKLFNIGNNVSTPGTDSEPGTGLGLVLCKEFMKLNQGSINITSKENIGTTVTITLPAEGELQ